MNGNFFDDIETWKALECRVILTLTVHHFFQRQFFKKNLPCVDTMLCFEVVFHLFLQSHQYFSNMLPINVNLLGTLANDTASDAPKATSPICLWTLTSFATEQCSKILSSETRTI